MTTAVESGAEGIRWDLTPLAPSEEAMKERLAGGADGRRRCRPQRPGDLERRVRGPRGFRRAYVLGKGAVGAPIEARLWHYVARAC